MRRQGSRLAEGPEGWAKIGWLEVTVYGLAVLGLLNLMVIALH